MSPLIEPHRRKLRDMLEEKMPPEGADAVLAALPASEADMPATKDFVRAEISDLRAEMTAGFAQVRNEMTTGFSRADTNLKDLRVEMTEKFATAETNTNKLRAEMHDAHASMKRWVIATGIGLAGIGITLGGVLLAAINTLPS